MDHAIQESLLVPKRLNKQRLRRGIFEAWQNSCAYCGLPACIDSFKIAEDVLKERGLL